MDGPQAMVDRLVRATNDHDLDALVACFAEDYENETPVHPARGFRGASRCAGTGSRSSPSCPTSTPRSSRCAVDGDTAWTEWEMTGTRARRHARTTCAASSCSACATASRVGPLLPRAGRRGRRHRRRRGARPGRARMILVAGGTGRLGTLVVARLAGRRPRRAGADPRPGRARHLPARRPRSSLGDVRDRASVERAMVEGVTRSSRPCTASPDRAA